MKIYAAPMEGITTYLWRQVYHRIFGGADEYMTPFLSPNGNFSFQKKELAEVSQQEPNLIPQLITNRAEYFIWGAKELRRLGYTEVNFNLGCPSGTVVAKHKGAGMLTDPKELDAMLEEIFSAIPDMKISVKTRIGRYDAEEWPGLLEVYNHYPLAKLIIHPRVQKEMYMGQAHRDAFFYAAEHSDLPLVYNGDIVSINDPMLQSGYDIMIGRGLLINPALLRLIHGGKAATREEVTTYHDMLLSSYEEAYGAAMPAIYKMRGLWAYLGEAFTDAERYLRMIYKAKDLATYEIAAQTILRNCEMRWDDC